MAEDQANGERDELRGHVRAEVLDLDQIVTLRGGPDNVDKLRLHATRTHRAFVLDGQPVYGVSVFCALDDTGAASLDGLLSGRLATYRWVNTPRARQLVEAGFTLLATFARPHYTLLLDDTSEDLLGRLEVALGPAIENPYHRRGRSVR